MRVTYAIMLLGTGLAIIFLRDFLLLICFILIIILPILTYLLALYIAHNMEIIFEPAYYTVTMGNCVTINLTLVNKTWLPISCMRFKLISRNSLAIAGVKDNVEDFSTQILPLGKVHFDVAVTSPHCGNIRVEIENVRIYDILRLTYVTVRVKDNIAEITNLPLILKSDEVLRISKIDTDDSNVYSDQKKGEDTSQVFDYHKYSKGDNIKNINWKLSSRMNMLMVKEFSFPISSSTLVMAEMGVRTYDDIDAIISELFWVSHWMWENGYTHTIRWVGHDDLCENNYIVDPTICDDTVIVSALKQIYLGIVQQENVLLYGYLNSISYSNIIYIVRAVSVQMIEKLCEIALHSNLTIICNEDKSGNNLPSLRQELEAHGVRLIIV